MLKLEYEEIVFKRPPPITLLLEFITQLQIPLPIIELQEVLMQLQKPFIIVDITPSFLFKHPPTTVEYVFNAQLRHPLTTVYKLQLVLLLTPFIMV